MGANIPDDAVSPITPSSHAHGVVKFEAARPSWRMSSLRRGRRSAAFVDERVVDDAARQATGWSVRGGRTRDCSAKASSSAARAAASRSAPSETQGAARFLIAPPAPIRVHNYRQVAFFLESPARYIPSRARAPRGAVRRGSARLLTRDPLAPRPPGNPSQPPSPTNPHAAPNT